MAIHEVPPLILLAWL